MNKGFDRVGISLEIHYNPKTAKVNCRRVNTIIGADTTTVPPWVRSPAATSPRNGPKTPPRVSDDSR